MKIKNINNIHVWTTEEEVVPDNQLIAQGINPTDHEKKYMKEFVNGQIVLDQVRIDKDIADELFKNSIAYRDTRAKLYTERLSPEKTQINALGDCVDALVESFVLNGLTPSPKLQSIITVIQQIKTEVPKPL